MSAIADFLTDPMIQRKFAAAISDEADKDEEGGLRKYLFPLLGVLGAGGLAYAGYQALQPGKPAPANTDGRSWWGRKLDSLESLVPRSTAPAVETTAPARETTAAEHLTRAAIAPLDIVHNLINAKKPREDLGTSLPYSAAGGAAFGALGRGLLNVGSKLIPGHLARRISSIGEKELKGLARVGAGPEVLAQLGDLSARGELGAALKRRNMPPVPALEATVDRLRAAADVASTSTEPSNARTVELSTPEYQRVESELATLRQSSDPEVRQVARELDGVARRYGLRADRGPERTTVTVQPGTQLPDVRGLGERVTQHNTRAESLGHARRLVDSPTRGMRRAGVWGAVLAPAADLGSRLVGHDREIR